MGREYTFYDYIDADGGGSNVIKNWLNGPGKDAKAHFTNIMPYLESLPPPWMNKYTTLMRGEWDGFIELRKTGRVQYRLLGQMIGRDIYLVACGTHKDQYYTTDVTPQTALTRVSQMINNPAKYRRKHEYH
jgi:hypothetical protein